MDRVEAVSILGGATRAEMPTPRAYAGLREKGDLFNLLFNGLDYSRILMQTVHINRSHHVFFRIFNQNRKRSKCKKVTRV